MTARQIIGWILSIVASAMFALAGYLKLTSNPMETQAFAMYGLPLWFVYVVGVMEIAGVILLLFTKWRTAGAALLTVVGLGATFEHATHAQLAMAPIPLAAAACAIVGAMLREPKPDVGRSERAP